MLKIEHPGLCVGKARLHGGLGRLIDACRHGDVELESVPVRIEASLCNGNNESDQRSQNGGQ